MKAWALLFRRLVRPSLVRDLVRDDVVHLSVSRSPVAPTYRIIKPIPSEYGAVFAKDCANVA